MDAKPFTVHVPATTSNLGPGFDVLGLALDLWNSFAFEPALEWQVRVLAYGHGELPESPENRVVQAFRWVFQELGEPEPPGLRVTCLNRIPVGSGLGSSATATLAGMAAALRWLGLPLDRERLLNWAARWEGHPDNVAPALWGGLVAAGWEDDARTRVWVLPLELHERWLKSRVVVALAHIHLPTEEARKVLPRQVSLEDAVYNLAHALLVVEGLRRGDPDLLRKGMRDRWHQAHRLRLIPGGELAMQSALEVGATAVMVSGAGPALLAWVADQRYLIDVGKALGGALLRYNKKVQISVWNLYLSQRGLWIEDGVTVPTDP